MCKILIKKVDKVHTPKSGGTAGNEWTLSIFDCQVQVDGSEVVNRTVKTFEKDIAEKIGKLQAGETLNFKAEKEGEQSPCTYMIRKQKKNFSRERSQGSQKSNRQLALECAVRGRATTFSAVLAAADRYLAWLEAG